MNKLITLSFLLVCSFPVLGQIYEGSYQNGNLAERGELLGNLQHGPWEFFYVNGNLREISNWSEGITDGAFKSYYPLGVLN